jgi:hypothetical protein
MQVGGFRFVAAIGGRAAKLVLVAASITACSTDSGRQENIDRGDLFTDIASGIDFNAPSDVSGRQGSAVFNGVGTGNFGGFQGTSDTRLTVNFSDRSINGNMTNWEDTDPLNYVLQGQVALSNGALADDGSFTMQVAGNIERDLRGQDDPAFPPQTVLFNGTVSDGQIFDSVDGRAASHLQGSFTGTDLNGGDVSGGFVARR